MSQKINILDRPNKSGKWKWRKDANSEWQEVEAHCGPASGMAVKELRQGGSIHCGFEFWSGEYTQDEV